ncbi:MAG: hypothetical protein Q9213_006831 [Squamulea squamosa]
MCVNLCPSRDSDTTSLATQDSLSGTLVSSLHRLKDVDNLDGGFFVFGDLSVKIEGTYRLRFSLFEMCKTEVVFIKSIVSSIFTVWNGKAFPGMAESTFLSRSFGDQGVRLRIRKEPRSLLGKRPVSISTRSDDLQSSVDDTISASTQRDLALQSQRSQIGTYGLQYEKGAEPSHKRQRASVDFGGRDVYDLDRHHQRPYFDPRAPPGTYTVRDQTGNIYNSTYGQTPQSALSNVSDYTFGHQRTNSSNTSSPFTSPHTEVSGHSWSATNSYYQPSVNNTQYNYTNYSYPDMPLNRQPQIADAPTRYRGQTFASRLPTNHNFAFSRPQDSDSSTTANYSNTSRSLPLSSSYDESSLRLPSTDQLGDLASSNRQQYPSASVSNVLPPLEATLGSTQSRGVMQQILPSHVIPSIEPPDLDPAPSQPTQDRSSESYDAAGFGFSLPEPKRPGEG